MANGFIRARDVNQYGYNDTNMGISYSPTTNNDQPTTNTTHFLLAFYQRKAHNSNDKMF